MCLKPRIGHNTGVRMGGGGDTAAVLSFSESKQSDYHKTPNDKSAVALSAPRQTFVAVAYWIDLVLYKNS